jgi:hypothetical protein
MIAEPKCYKRKCKHYIGVHQPDGTEETETYICAAYPHHIPFDIAYGRALHLKVRRDQMQFDNQIVFEPIGTEEEQ